MVNENLPFNLPSELCEIIFDQLRAKDLLNCTLVCCVWHDFITQSTIFEKVTLTINAEMDIKEVFKSNRKYANFVLLNIRREKLLKCLKLKAKKLEIVGNFSFTSKNNRFYFPKLSELTLSNVNDSTFHPIMNFQEKLTVLNLHNLKITRFEKPVVNDFLKLCKNLTELNLYLTEHGNIFHHETDSDFNFNLESVTISFRSNFEIDALTLANIEKFLINQGDSLKVISLINATSLSSVYRIWNDLKSIERLYFFSADPFFDIGISEQMETKELLKALEIHILGPLQLDLQDLLPILSATRNLESFGVWNLTQDLVEFCAMNLMNLENLFCATIDKECESFYNQLKSKNGINSKIKLHQYL